MTEHQVAFSIGAASAVRTSPGQSVRIVDYTLCKSAGLPPVRVTFQDGVARNTRAAPLRAQRGGNGFGGASRRHRAAGRRLSRTNVGPGVGGREANRHRRRPVVSRQRHDGRRLCLGCGAGTYDRAAAAGARSADNRANRGSAIPERRDDPGCRTARCNCPRSKPQHGAAAHSSSPTSGSPVRWSSTSVATSRRLPNPASRISARRFSAGQAGRCPRSKSCAARGCGRQAAARRRVWRNGCPRRLVERCWHARPAAELRGAEFSKASAPRSSAL